MPVFAFMLNKISERWSGIVSHDKNSNMIPIVITVAVVLFFVWVATLPKGHWFIGLWNWFMVNRY